MWRDYRCVSRNSANVFAYCTSAGVRVAVRSSLGFVAAAYPLRTATSNQASAGLSWEDTTGFGGHDDSTNVMVEIRHVSGPCGAGREWQLQVEGNAQ